MKHIYTFLFTLVLCCAIASTAQAQDNNGGVKVDAPKGLATRNNNQLGKNNTKPQTKSNNQDNKTAAPKTAEAKPAESKTTAPKTATTPTNSGDAAKKKTENTTTTTTTKSNAETTKKPTYNTQQTVKKRSVGFRIQAFTDNNYSNAKANAQARAKSIAMKFPQYRSYISYKAPTWKLRIGDFQTQQEAKAAIASIKKAFPSFASELIIVRDKINVWQ